MTSRVAIVGGGIAGLSLASFLSRGSANVHVTVFDTGERACGGRLSSKSIDGVDVDHGAQYFTSTSQVFREEFVKPLLEAHVVDTWSDAAVGVLRSGEGFEAFKDGADRYVGVGGFRALAEHLEGYADDVRRPQWVGAMSASRFDTNGRITEWRLATSDNDRAKQLGVFDFVVIAHNGKCAHRLASTAKGDGACHKVRNSLKCVFGVKPNDEIAAENRLVLSSIWSVMVVLEGDFDFGFEGAHVVDGEPLSWVSNISAKRKAGASASSSSAGKTCIVLQSTAEYARDNKVPQEAVPKEKAREVMESLVAALERCTNRTLLDKVVDFKSQLWGAANPLNVANVDAVLDFDTNTAAIGDWCSTGPACVESAVLSAHALATALDEHFSGETLSAKSRALASARVKWSLPRNGANTSQGGFPGTNVPSTREASPMPPKRSGRGRGGRGGRGGRRGGRRGGSKAASPTMAKREAGKI